MGGLVACYAKEGTVADAEAADGYALELLVGGMADFDDGTSFVPSNAGDAVSLTAEGDGARYAVKGNGLVLRLPESVWSGVAWRTDAGDSGVVTGDYRRIDFAAKGFSRLNLIASGDRRLTLDFASPVDMQGSGTRLYWRPCCKLTFRAATNLSCRVTADKPVVASIGPKHVVAAGAEWVPYQYRKDILPGSALDFSSLVDAPAGKYGRVVVTNGHFAFSACPERRIRFAGVNLCGTANCPDKDLTDRFIPRLRRLGYNSIRIHHHEKPLTTGDDGLSFNEENLDRFDYLVAKAVENGLYLTTDMYVSRPVKGRALGLREKYDEAFKPLVLFGYAPAVENWKMFSKKFLTHVNPYTGRSLLDEPALVSVVLINEGHLAQSIWRIRDIPAVKKETEAWESKFGWDEDAKTRFCVAREIRTENDLKGYLRSIGYKGLVSGDNNAPYYPMGRVKLRNLYDYADRHMYVDHPHALGKKWRLPTFYHAGNPLLYPAVYMSQRCSARQFGCPFVSSEWNFTGAGSYRSMSGLLTGSLAGAQDWDGLWRFAYSHGAAKLMDGTGSPQGFDLARDPLLQATDRTTLMLFLRGDMPMAGMAVGRELPPDESLSSLGANSIDFPWADRVAWDVRLGTVFNGDRHVGVVNVPYGETSVRAPDLRFPQPLKTRIDWKTGNMTVVTPRTCGGFAEVGVCETAGPLSFRVAGHRATVTASSIDGRPLEGSSRILLSHLTDCAAEKAAYLGKARCIVVANGRDGKWLLHRGNAEVALRFRGNSNWCIYALDSAGGRVSEVPCRVEEGTVRFVASICEKTPSLHYEMERCEQHKGSMNKIRKERSK